MAGHTAARERRNCFSMFRRARRSLRVLPVVTVAPEGCCQMRWRVCRTSTNPNLAAMGAMVSRRAMGQSSWVKMGRRAIASCLNVSAWAPANHTASMVMGLVSPMVCCASSVSRPAHTIWRVRISDAMEKIIGLSGDGVISGGR